MNLKPQHFSKFYHNILIRYLKISNAPALQLRLSAMLLLLITGNYNYGAWEFFY